MKLSLVLPDTLSATSPMWQEDTMPVRRLGESGELITSALINDDYVAMGILVMIVFTVVCAMASQSFLIYQFENSLRVSREDSAKLREAISSKKYLHYFTLQAVLLLGLQAYCYSTQALGFDFSIGRYAMTGVYAAIFLLYLVAVFIVRSINLYTYYDRTQRVQFNVEHSFFLSLTGIALLPISIAYVFNYIDVIQMVYATLAVVVFVKIWAFYKSFLIFFRKNASILQFFLYLCTLEIVPLALLIGILTFTTIILKINI